jgi:excisionase family DNA binding protein
MDSERWYTVQQIATMLQVHEQTVREWLRTGQLRGRSFGGRTGWRVRERDLAAFLDGGDESKKAAA